MHVMVEGFDNSGKTTLINQLAPLLKYTTVKQFKKPTSQEDILSYHEWLMLSPRPLLLDRSSLVSEAIYGPLLRKREFLSRERILSMRCKYFLIYCRPQSSTPWGDRAQMDGVIQNSIKLQALYDEFMKYLMPDFIYDYRDHSVEEVFRAIRRANNPAV